MGLQAVIVEIEVEVEPGLRSFEIIGLPDEAVREASKRVASALKSAGFQSPGQMNRKITVNLAPADIKKQGSFFDLAIALGFLAASGQLALANQRMLAVGELSLDGLVRPVPGILAIAQSATAKKFTLLLAPKENHYETALIEGLEVIGVRDLAQAVAILKKEVPADSFEASLAFVDGSSEFDLYDIKGQDMAKRSLEIAGAGGHHLFMLGPPGAGKSILAKIFPSLLPGLTPMEGREVATVLSSLEPLSHFLRDGQLALSRPFRAPHHSASAQAILGGGAPIKPGEITLAHRGILFLDEFPEFRRDVLEGLRQPLESREIIVTRSHQRVTFPAQFQLIGAANPCPCGYKNDERQACVCTPGALNRYERKLSGPLMDRVDMFIWVPRLSAKEILQEGAGKERSAMVRARVDAARRVQYRRFSASKLNADMTLREVKVYCAIDETLKTFLAQAIERFNLSMRAYHKILKVSRTIADLAGAAVIRQEHIAQALQYRKPVS